MKSRLLHKETIYLAIIILSLGVALQSYYTYKYEPADQIHVYYNQDQPLNNEVINTIRDADKYVYFAVYTFTRRDIEQALLAAKYRGLTVIGITDKSQYQSAPGQKAVIDALVKSGIQVYQQNSSGIMHMKVLVTDKAYLSGSYNWTTSATDINDEVLEVGTDPAVRVQYQQILEEVFDRYKDFPVGGSAGGGTTNTQQD